jgi:cytochrome P450
LFVIGARKVLSPSQKGIAMPATTPRPQTSDPVDEANVPTGVQLTPMDAVFRNDPYPVLQRLRNAERVHRDEALSRWFVTGFEEVRDILRNKDLSSNINNASPDSYIGRVRLNAQTGGMTETFNSILFKDDPDHRRLRALVSKPFGPKAVEDARPRIRANVEALLDTLTEPYFDLVKSFTGPLPVIVIAEMLGVAPDMRAQFKQWSEDITAGFFNPLRLEEQTQHGARAQQALSEYLSRVITVRRRQPGNDLISNMITADEGAEPLTDAEIRGQTNLLLIAGNLTTSDLIANSLKALLSHPEQLAALRADPGLIGNAVEEVLRYDSPVTQANRILANDMSFSGCPMHTGQSITVSLAGANHDPRGNPEPDTFDIRRRDIRHQSFGGGRHLCLGAWLARVEAQEAILGLLRRFPRLSLNEQTFEYRPVPSFRGLQQLWVTS